MSNNIKLIKEEKFCKLYWKSKELYNLILEYDFGAGISLPSRFTEQLCRQLYNLKKYEVKDNTKDTNKKAFDAVDEHGNNIEIKATTSKSSSTTISTEEFDLLYWMRFSLDTDELFIYSITGEEIRSNSEYQEIIKDPRNNITLKKFLTDKHLIDVYKFNTI
ncbi:hypothetical protein ACQKMV_05310 [Lysinibacillus sp. NPDC094403]|uniref:hypothetical protein n=1 Tax=Lysinibacillus sp. NPDC094403 TaxID=3390581 RepID=UPI003D03902B